MAILWSLAASYAVGILLVIGLLFCVQVRPCSQEIVQAGGYPAQQSLHLSDCDHKNRTSLWSSSQNVAALQNLNAGRHLTLIILA